MILEIKKLKDSDLLHFPKKGGRGRYEGKAGPTYNGKSTLSFELSEVHTN